MSVEEQFRAAVKVIQGLPKNGPFQPSHDMMRKFYSLYKQATEGPCSMEKPPFYNLIQREKYNAWSALGDMTKEEAMTRYVEEIKQIVETMSFNVDVAQLMEVLGPFYEFVKEDEGGKNEGDFGIDVKVEHEENIVDLALGKFTGEDGDEELELKKEGTKLFQELQQTEAELQRAIGLLEKNATVAKSMVRQCQSDSSDSDNDVYEDPLRPEDLLEGEEEELSEREDVGKEEILPTTSIPSRPSSESENVSQSVSPHAQHPEEVELVLRTAVQLLNKDVAHILARVSNLEKFVYDKAQNSAWPCQELSSGTVVFILSWPFIAQGIMALASTFKGPRP